MFWTNKLQGTTSIRIYVAGGRAADSKDLWTRPRLAGLTLWHEVCTCPTSHPGHARTLVYLASNCLALSAQMTDSMPVVVDDDHAHDDKTLSPNCLFANFTFRNGDSSIIESSSGTNALHRKHLHNFTNEHNWTYLFLNQNPKIYSFKSTIVQFCKKKKKGRIIAKGNEFKPKQYSIASLVAPSSASTSKHRQFNFKPSTSAPGSRTGFKLEHGNQVESIKHCHQLEHHCGQWNLEPHPTAAAAGSVRLMSTLWLVGLVVTCHCELFDWEQDHSTHPSYSNYTTGTHHVRDRQHSNFRKGTPGHRAYCMARQLSYTDCDTRWSQTCEQRTFFVSNNKERQRQQQQATNRINSIRTKGSNVELLIVPNVIPRWLEQATNQWAQLFFCSLRNFSILVNVKKSCL